MMSDQAVVERVCADAQLPQSVRDRAMSHLRLLTVRSGGAAGGISKHAVACALAATQLGAPFERKKLVSLSGVNEAAFQQAFATMQSLLRIRMAQLSSLAKASRRLFDAYRERRLAQLDASLRASASFDDQPALAIAVVELAMRKKKAVGGTSKFDAAALCASTNVTSATYRSTYDHVMSVCFPQWFAAEQESKAAATAEKQLRAQKAAARDPEKKRKFDDDYEDWRQRVTDRTAQCASSSTTTAAAKQSSLLSFVRANTIDDVSTATEVVDSAQLSD